MNVQTIFCSAALGIAAALDPLLALAGEPRHLTERGICSGVPGTGICTCSLSSIETLMTFSEAAGVVELFYRGNPDEAYVSLLVDLMKQCSGEPSSTPLTHKQKNTAVSAPVMQ
jgi:hypothetical protein